MPRLTKAALRAIVETLHDQLQEAVGERDAARQALQQLRAELETIQRVRSGLEEALAVARGEEARVRAELEVLRTAAISAAVRLDATDGPLGSRELDLLRKGLGPWAPGSRWFVEAGHGR